MPGEIDAVEFELPSADGSGDGATADSHAGSGLAWRRAFRRLDPDEDDAFMPMRDEEGGEAHEAASALTRSTASSTRSGVAGASRRGQIR